MSAKNSDRKLTLTEAARIASGKDMSPPDKPIRFDGESAKEVCLCSTCTEIRKAMVIAKFPDAMAWHEESQDSWMISRKYAPHFTDPAYSREFYTESEAWADAYSRLPSSPVESAKRFTPPRYDETYFEAMDTLDKISSGEIDDGLSAPVEVVAPPAPWDRNVDQDQKCLRDDCSHSYYRHFDSYADNEPVGCKYCPCFVFLPQPVEVVAPKKWSDFDHSWEYELQDKLRIEGRTLDCTAPAEEAVAPHGPMNARDQSAHDAGCTCPSRSPYMGFGHDKECSLYWAISLVRKCGACGFEMTSDGWLRCPKCDSVLPVEVVAEAPDVEERWEAIRRNPDNAEDHVWQVVNATWWERRSISEEASTGSKMIHNWCSESFAKRLAGLPDLERQLKAALLKINALERELAQRGEK